MTQLWSGSITWRQTGLEKTRGMGGESWPDWTVASARGAKVSTEVLTIIHFFSLRSVTSQHEVFKPATLLAIGGSVMLYGWYRYGKGARREQRYADSYPHLACLLTFMPLLALRAFHLAPLRPSTDSLPNNQ
ncbi:hypothetical protein OPQ81_011978 [Rhizoctonia solani]|nr:hypothetical protein OPQ81_011978 [Rhizoctonia solani]